MNFIPSEIAAYLETLLFKSNPNLRPVGTSIAYTAEMVDEYIKCSQDPAYFISKYVKVIHPDRGLVTMELYDYQIDMVNNYHKNRFTIVRTARQQGKCCSINTNVKLKKKSTGEIVEVTLGEFYVWQRFKEYIQENLQEMLQRVRGISDKQTVPDMQGKDFL
jgi:hypothetical protein